MSRPLELAIHVIIILLGVIVLFLVKDSSDSFWQSLGINIGSSLIVITMVFSIFEAFRREEAQSNVVSASSSREKVERRKKGLMDSQFKDEDEDENEDEDNPSAKGR